MPPLDKVHYHFMLGVWRWLTHTDSEDDWKVDMHFKFAVLALREWRWEKEDNGRIDR